MREEIKIEADDNGVKITHEYFPQEGRPIACSEYRPYGYIDIPEFRGIVSPRRTFGVSK